MRNVTIKGLLAHKLRLALTALAIVLGVTFISGTFVLTDTLHNTFSVLLHRGEAGPHPVGRACSDVHHHRHRPVRGRRTTGPERPWPRSRWRPRRTLCRRRAASMTST